MLRINHMVPAQPVPFSPPATEQIHRFHQSVAGLLETWVRRRASAHTQRAYRQDVLTFVRFLGLPWPEQSHELLSASVPDVQNYRDWLLAKGAARKTLNRRIASLSSFYRYLGACAAELRLPVNLPNPAHSQFIARGAADPRTETCALSLAAARQLLSLPVGHTLREVRDRALLRLFLYTGIRLSTACRLQAGDFLWDGSGTATLRLREKGERFRTIGIHHAAAVAVQEYIDRAAVVDGPLFRPLAGPRTDRLQNRPLSPAALYLLLLRYLARLPGAVRGPADGPAKPRCIYTPHSLRATTATLLLQQGVDIVKVQELLGHRHITTTQIYDKRRRSVAESASHEISL